MPLPNTSPLMSPTPTTVIDVGADVLADLAEVALARSPSRPRAVMPIALWS
jgi:hypothetical protein